MTENYWLRKAAITTGRRRFLAGGALIGVGASSLALVGCGGDDNTKASSPGATTAGSPAAKASVGPVKKGGVLRVAKVQNDPPTFDPQSSLAAPLYEISDIYMERLLTLDATGNELTPKPLKPSLAKAWEQPSADTAVFHLETAAKWHSIAPVNGRAFTSADAKATFDRIMDPAAKSPLSGLIKDFVASFQATDPATLTVKLKTPFGALFEVLASDFIAMLPEEGTKGGYDLEKVHIGTGAFTLKEKQPGVQYVYEANRSYRTEVNLDRIEQVVFTDATALGAAIAAGQLHVARMLRGQDLNIIPTDKYTLYRVPGTVRQELAIMRTGTPLKDVRVRQAIRSAIDQDDIIKKAYSGDAAFCGVIPKSSIWGTPEDQARKLYAPDLTKAKQLLDAAGLPNGFTNDISTSTVYGPAVLQSAEVALAQLARVGIKGRALGVEHATILKAEYACDYSLVARILSGDSGNGLYDWGYKNEHTNGLYSIHNCANVPPDEKLNQIALKAAAAMTQDEQKAANAELQAYLYEVSYFVPMAGTNNNMIARKDVQGWGFSPSDTILIGSPDAARYWLNS